MQPTSITPQPPSSYYSNFTYQGPSLDPYNAGLFVQTRHYFLDDNCKVPFYDVLEQGTFQQVNASQIVPVSFG